MLLFINFIDVLIFVEVGVNIIIVNIGGMVFCEGKYMIINVVFVDEMDEVVFCKLDEKGIEFEICKVVFDNKVKFILLLDKDK